MVLAWSTVLKIRGPQISEYRGMDSYRHLLNMVLECTLSCGMYQILVLSNFNFKKFILFLWPRNVPERKFHKKDRHNFCPQGSTASSWPRPPHDRGFTIRLRHIILGRTPLDEYINSYLSTQNTHKRQTSILPAGFKLAIPACVWPQTHALDRAAVRFGS